MTEPRLIIAIALVLAMALFSCVTGRSTAELIKLRLDMTKDEVIKTLGESNAARGSMRNKYGQVVEVWEYALRNSENEDNMYMTNRKYCFWLYFYDGRLVQWGAAGDWQRDADRIYEMRFR